MTLLNRISGKPVSLARSRALSESLASSRGKWQSAALLGALALGASYLVVRSKTQQAERAFPPSGKFVTVNGVRLHYLEAGQGPALVLLHGNGTMAADFAFAGLIEQLAKNFHVLAFDRPGYGYSERPRSTVWTPQAQATLLRDALETLGVRQAIVLGHSWGSMVALAMGLLAPQLVRSLVLLSGYYYPSVRMDVVMSSGPAIPLVGDVMRYTTSPLLGRLLWPALLKRLFGPSPVAASFRRMPVWLALRPGQLRASAAESALMIPSAARLDRHYGELRMPVLIMAGAGDLVVSAEHNSLRLHREIAHSQLRMLPGLGHMVHHLAQRDIVQAVADFAIDADDIAPDDASSLASHADQAGASATEGSGGKNRRKGRGAGRADAPRP